MRVAAALLALTASACVGQAEDDADVREAGRQARDDLEGFPRDEYPPGPYGVGLLAEIADYGLQGRDGAVTLSELRQDPGRRAVWIVVGAPWCPSCRAEAPVVGEIARRFEPDGLVVLPVVATNLEGRRPDRSDIDAVYPELATATFDPWGDPSLTLDLAPDRRIVLPQSLVVDLSSMRIVALVTGWDEDALRAVLERQLAQ